MLFKKNQEHNEDGSPDRYLITYSDLITLLLGLFVILYAISKIDESKYSKVSEAFSSAFKNKDKPAFNSHNGTLPGFKNSVPEPIAPPSGKSLEDIAKESSEKFSTLIEKKLLEIKLTSNGLLITFPEKLLFHSGKADIQKAGLDVLDSLSKILAGITFLISIDGHTDSDPISNALFPSNWHLSTMRAANVGYFLIKKGVQESSMKISGYSDQRPVSDNSTLDGKAKNRRVEMNISQLPSNAPSAQGYAKEDSSKSSQLNK
ncbi:MAG: OmpA family protein [Candidatus Kapabacteria bacterium]|nr:OmpA family protein [Candidatus Kapabacteria bacterium]